MKLCVLSFNGDGFKPDIAISSPGSGVVHILLARSSNTRRYPLKPGLDGIFQFLVISDGVQGSKFGTSIAALGDFNRDGKDDIAVGAPGAGEGGTVYVVKGFFGSFSSSTNPFLLTLEGGLGESIGNYLPDGAMFNDDTYADLLVPTSSKSPNRSAYLIYGSAEYNDTHLSTLTLDPSKNAIFVGLDNVISPISAHCRYMQPISKTRVPI